MKRLIIILSSLLCMSALASAQYDQPAPVLEDYFSPCTSATATPDAKGFIHRWSLLEPIAKPEIRTNAIFTDSWLRAEFGKQLFDGQSTIVPKDGQKVKLDKKTKLAWHCLDSKNYNVKLYRFATGLGLHPVEALYWAVTVIDCPEEAVVRLAVGSNSASMWWIDGQETLLLSGDRRMVVDDCVSRFVTLPAGKHIIRGCVINGPGMSDFCVRFLDKDGNPYTNYSVSNQ